MTQLFWRIYVDWDNDGVLESNEANRTQHVWISRGRDAIINESGKGFKQPKVGKATLTWENYDQRYDPFYTSSPLYDNVAPGRTAQIGVETGGVDTLLLETGDKLLLEDGGDIFLSDGTFYALMTGKIDNIIPKQRGGVKYVTTYILDGWRELRDADNVRVDVALATNTNTSIGAILDEIGWPAADRSLTGNGDNLGYWWSEDGTAAENIWSLVESNMGQISLSDDGKVTFTDRHSLYNDTAGVIITDDEVLKNVNSSYPWDLIRNYVNVIVNPTVTLSGVQLWKMHDKPFIHADTTQPLITYADLSYGNNPVVITSLTTPTTPTDFTANAQVDGGGVDLSANISITTTTLGRAVKLEIYNTGTTNAYLTLMKLRGDAIYQPEVCYEEQSDTTSQNSYGLRSFVLDLPWQQSLFTGNDFSNWLLSWMKDPKQAPLTTMENRPANQFGYDLNARITYTSAKQGIDSDFYIGKIIHEWRRATGQGVRTTWHLEPIDMTEYWEFPTQLGITSRLAY